MEGKIEYWESCDFHGKRQLIHLLYNVEAKSYKPSWEGKLHFKRDCSPNYIYICPNSLHMRQCWIFRDMGYHVHDRSEHPGSTCMALYSSICTAQAFLSSSFPGMSENLISQKKTGISHADPQYLASGFIDHRQLYKEGMGWRGSHNALHIKGICPWSKLLDRVSKLVSTGWPTVCLKPVKFLPLSLLCLIYLLE